MKASILMASITIIPAMVIATKASDTEKTPWKSVASAKDIERLNNWRMAFDQARREAVEAGFAKDISDGATLFKSDAALKKPQLPAGYYSCRVTKLGGNFVQFVQYPAFRCQVTFEGGRRQFVKLSGSQRPVGYIYRKDALQDVFLGTIALGDESTLVSYGKEEERNTAGLIERIGTKRWRILFPFPHYESTMDVIELQRLKN